MRAEAARGGSETLICPSSRAWCIELGAGEVGHQNPGYETPAMVYGPFGTSGSWLSVTDTGEIWNSRECLDVPIPVLNWLSCLDETVASFVAKHRHGDAG